jgi:hypothetical protein
MNKYPLIGVTILAVVLLILGSLSNVVGYQSIQSSGVDDSPLFSVRTQRATNQQQNTITSLYIGKGMKASIQFPRRDNKTELVIKAIKDISKMDEETFTRFTVLCIQAQHNTNFNNANTNEIRQALQLLRIKPDIIIDLLMNRNKLNITIKFPKICFIRDIIIIIYYFVLILFASLLTYSLTCSPGSFCGGSRCTDTDNKQNPMEKLWRNYYHE